MKQVIIELPFEGGIMNWLHDNGKPAYTGHKNFEEYKKDREKPGKEIILISWDEYSKMYEDYWVSEWQEINETEYWEYIEQLPPLKVVKLTKFVSCFFCLEATTGYIHACYISDRLTGKYYAASKSRYLTASQLLDTYITFLTSHN